MSKRNGVCVTLIDGSIQWFGVTTFAHAAALIKCGPGQIERFNFRTKLEHAEDRAGGYV